MGTETIFKSDEGKRIITEHYENYLESFPFDFDRKYVETSYGTTHILVAGPLEGKPIFIFQGGNCINPMTFSWFSLLTEKYRIYAPDTIGHPGFSGQNRMSVKDHSFAAWTKELMDFFKIKSCAFIGPSYGAGIILRLATFMPKKIDCAILVAPAGIKLGSKFTMIKDILLPLILLNITSSEKYLHKITSNMSDNKMKEIDITIIGDIFKYLKLEQKMPKLTKKEELTNYNAPTLIIAGKKDIFFPEKRLIKTARKIIPNLISIKTYDIGDITSDDHRIEINNDIKTFLEAFY